MLLLRRRVHDSILIGDDIEVRVVKVVDAEVTLGIEAPASVLVDRKEVRAKRVAVRTNGSGDEGGAEESEEDHA